MKCKFQERRTKKENETPADRAARVTATATYWMALFTFVLAVVGVATLCVLRIQLKEMHEGGVDTHDLAVAASKQADRMKDLADRMKDQAEATHDLAVAAGKQADASRAFADLTAQQFTASQRLIESQRASITVAFAYVNNPVTFQDGSLSVVFSVALRNVGRLTANKVKIRFKPYFSQWGENIFSEPMRQQRDFCAKPNVLRLRKDLRDLRGLTSDDALTITPGETKESQINFGMGKPSQGELVEFPNDPTGKKRVFPIVVGCVDYQSGAMIEPHQTGFIFEVQQMSVLNPGLPTMINYGENVPRESVVVIPYFFGQGKNY